MAINDNYSNFRAYANRDRKTESGGGSLKSSGGDGTFDSMEARVAVLETLVERVADDLSEMRTDIRAVRDDIGGKGGLREKQATAEIALQNLPTKDWVSGRIWIALGVITVLLGLQLGIQRALMPTPTAVPSAATASPTSPASTPTPSKKGG